jgi:hypothetical protein
MSSEPSRGVTPLPYPPLSVFDDGGRTVKAHRLVIQQRARERCQISDLEKRARVRKQRETSGMRFRKP